MNFTQNEKLKQLSERSIVIGVDIASELHYARAFDWRGVELGKVFKFENSAEGFKNLYAWIERIKRQAQKDSIVVGAEPTGHYWFGLASYLKEQNIKLVLVNPFHVKRSKELDDNHPSKTDAKDPKTIAKLVIEGRYNEPYIPEGLYAELRIAVTCRVRIQKEMNSIKNRIQRWLKIYFPEHETVFGKFDATSSMLVLQVAPLPRDIERLGVEGINRIWRDNKLRAVGMKRAKSLYEAAQKSIGCTEGESCSRMEIQLLLQDYHTKTAQYQAVTETIDGLCRQIPEVAKLLEIKGVGLVTVAGFLSEVGDIKRFNSPKQIQKLAGLALRESSSGKHKGQTTISKRGRARLRAILFQAVMPLVAKNAEFAEIHNYYTTRTQNPLKKKQSLIALSCKLIRVFYAILTKGTDYDPKKLIMDIHRPVEYLAA
ncbi:transposase IS116/IS110/IS902 family protein [Desulfitobacterium hafniense DCB-2]|uniref:Transposase IS116/IS110/IS902 family protein n=1 Tax=Desulfitobacterium hafniense (strain DSM 10664 / DCB-2) TaxID=272564 RepID=B8FXQ7_DESHD|nr:IS110 family transposase [Desulfitobacterium hafniense]ACL19024.1 transposase IS116/IS110/IS902 family protein [Desulfitobacterium hafniense DCB-2]ACL22658.1 transposase IS116/IS110/IS902 family protein [Desulfitobacterium hafniense DCB-2]